MHMHIFSVKAVIGWLGMKRVLAGILVFDMVMGMLCLMVGIKQEERAKQWEIHEETTSDSREAAAGSVVCEEEEVAKKIALTFDDGPHPIYTEELLDGLKKRKVLATFFLIGNNIDGNEEML